MLQTFSGTVDRLTEAIDAAVRQRNQTFAAKRVIRDRVTLSQDANAYMKAVNSATTRSNTAFAKALRGPVNLSGADLRGVPLQRADLSGFNLSGTNLSHASLRGTNLSNANLMDADLRGADLTDANLSGASLQGADLRKVRGLTDRQMESALLSQNAILY